MRYSLINISKKIGNKVEGSWIQDHYGTLETARAKADATEAANSNKITVAVVEGIASPSILNGPLAPKTRLA